MSSDGIKPTSAPARIDANMLAGFTKNAFMSLSFLLSSDMTICLNLVGDIPNSLNSSGNIFFSYFSNCI